MRKSRIYAGKKAVAAMMAAVLLICAFPMPAFADNNKINELEDEIKRKKEEKRHREAERLAQEAIQKQDAEIKDLSEKAKDAEHLGTINEALVKALESEKNKGGESDEEE